VSVVNSDPNGITGKPGCSSRQEISVLFIGGTLDIGSMVYKWRTRSARRRAGRLFSDRLDVMQAWTPWRWEAVYPQVLAATSRRAHNYGSPFEEVPLNMDCERTLSKSGSATVVLKLPMMRY
jgi:hypothetical protein